MTKLTEAQRSVLRAMADGHEMVFSQDGEEAWLWPKHDTGFLTMEQTCDLRDLGLIGRAPYDDEDHYRFGSPDIITDLGRAALSEQKEERG